MTKGTAPVPPIAPALIAMMAYYCSGCITFLGSRNSGGEIPVSVPVFLNFSPEPFFIIEDFEIRGIIWIY